jgi:hypothetical protein
MMLEEVQMIPRDDDYDDDADGVPLGASETIAASVPYRPFTETEIDM